MHTIKNRKLINKGPGMIRENTNIPANIKIIESTDELYMGFERAKHSQ